MPARTRCLIGVLLGLTLLAAQATAQWSTDPLENLAIADRASEQILPKVSATSNLGSYIGWFDLASGNYDVYLQRLDLDGNELWPHNGILVSDHAQDSWLTDWDMLTDSDDHAVLVFSDIRGGNLDVHAYRISPSGESVWGPDGVTLSQNGDFEPTPRVTQASNGDLVFVWSRLPDAGDGKIMMQRLSPAGVEQLPVGGLPVAGDAGEDPAFCEIAAADNGNVIVSWVRDISTFMSPRHVRAEKFDANGASAWGGYVAVFDAGVVPIAHTPGIQSDGIGGALLYWHRSQSNMFNSFVQHLDAGGTELFPHNGVAVSLVPDRHHIDPTLSYQPYSGEIFVFWNERNANQSQWGIFGQKLSPTGERLWSDGAVELLPVDTVYKLSTRSVPVADGNGAMVFLIDEPTGTFGQNRVIGMRIDDDGQQLWGSSPVEVSSLLSGKSRLPIAIDAFGSVRTIWEDDRSGTVDVYGQNVNVDGTLGSCGCSLDSLTAPVVTGPVSLRQNRPNPFGQSTQIVVDVAALLEDAQLVIFDVTGRLVRRLEVPMLRSGSRSFAWDGRDGRGRPVAAGVYYYRLVHSEGVSPTRRAILMK